MRRQVYEARRAVTGVCMQACGMEACGGRRVETGVLASRLVCCALVLCMAFGARLRTARLSARLLRSRAMLGTRRSAENCSPLGSSAALSCWEWHAALG